MIAGSWELADWEFFSVAKLSLPIVRKEIASGNTRPLYMLDGEDQAEKSAVASEFAEIVDEDLRAFNVDRLYGGDITADDLADAANMLPMMAHRRVVVVFETEKLVIPKRESEAADEEMERFEAFLKDPAPHATVVFVCGALDERRRGVKLLRKYAEVVDCGTITDSASAAMWVKTRAAKEKANLDAGAVRALVDRAGIDIVRLRAGLERAMLYAMGKPTITADDVKASVPAAGGVPENFGIANAIGRNDAAWALRELALALESGAQPFFVLGQLRSVAERMPPARLPAAIDAIFRTDLALKSSGGDPQILLERLVVELCSSTRRSPS